MEKFSSVVAYVLALVLAFIGALSPQDIAFYVAAVAAAATCFINWYYRRKSYFLLKELAIRREVFDELNR
ncbi:HP1 family phage holin [Yersinia intermedia]|uniref:HP1 family phage holin n=1 Tax=Yersinia intermedia TaxID=631 RepID=UPI0022FECB7A|nr:HP1 family phage holin [Yersinia intermedia]MDA5483175.1 HP1 family phage holin [Yersinia intermedia]